MCLKPQPPRPMPPEMAAWTEKRLPPDNPYHLVGETLYVPFHDLDFADLYHAEGKPALSPWCWFSNTSKIWPTAVPLTPYVRAWIGNSRCICHSTMAGLMPVCCARFGSACSTTLPAHVSSTRCWRNSADWACSRSAAPSAATQPMCWRPCAASTGSKRWAKPSLRHSDRRRRCTWPDCSRNQAGGAGRPSIQRGGSSQRLRSCAVRVAIA